MRTKGRGKKWEEKVDEEKTSKKKKKEEKKKRMKGFHVELCSP